MPHFRRDVVANPPPISLPWDLVNADDARYESAGRGCHPLLLGPTCEFSVTHNLYHNLELACPLHTPYQRPDLS